MADTLSPAERSERMSRIKSKDTAPEITLRKALHRMGLRFRLHGRSLPGKPDIVFPRYRAVVMVHGCFWHRHSGCKVASVPKSNTQFWLSKFERNVERDAANKLSLESTGWAVITVWECELSSQAKRSETCIRVYKAITGVRPKREITNSD